MKALEGSCLKFFTCKQREKERVVLWSREISLIRQEIGFLGHQKRVSLAISFQQKYIRSISAASSPQTNVGSEEIQTSYSDQPKTVHMRFKLQKECAFGQQFLIVGDDPIFGLWNPSDGVPLIWSDGHIWTAEVDIPSGKVIKYKFILKGLTGNISWQPGPDRILETWDTEKTLTVFEDWDNPELRNIIEEELVVGSLNEESLINSDLLNVVENLNQPILDEGTNVIEELASVNGHMNHVEKPSKSMVAENISEELGEQDLSLSDKWSGLMCLTYQKSEETALGNDGSNLLSSKDETTLVRDDAVPVLVPGLVPMPAEEIESEELNKVEENNSVENTTIESDEIEDSTEAEIKDKHVSASVHSPERTTDITQSKDEHVSPSDHSTETTTDATQLKDEHVSASVHSNEKTSETVVDEKQQRYGTRKLDSKVLTIDMQWGRRTLQKFLANLGFQ